MALTARAALVAVLLLAGCGGHVSAPRASAGRPSAVERALPDVVGAYVTYHGRSRTFVIGNGLLARRIQVSEDGTDFATVSLRSLPTGVECLSGPQHDFAVTIGGRAYITGNRSLRYERHETSSDRRGSQRLRMYLRPAQQTPGDEAPFEVSVVYEVAKDSPVMQTWIEVENLGPVPVLVEDGATQLTTIAPDGAYVWRRSRRPTSVKLPMRGAPDYGLAWLQAATQQHGPMTVGVASAAPGPLKSISADREGRVSVGMAAQGGGMWAQPGQRIALPSAYMWVSVGPLVAQAAREWMDAIDLARRAVDVAAPAAGISVAPDNVDARWLATQDVNDIVCVRYAWQTAWDGEDDARGRVTAAVEAIRKSGRRAGLLAPVAWLPDGGRLAQDPTLALATVVGAPFSSSWGGRSGVLASLSSDYGDVALRSLIALVDDLELHAILLDGPVTARIDSGGARGAAWHAPWESWNGLLRLVSGLKRERPDVHIGVSAETYGQDDGFDVTLHPMAFLWRFGGQARYDGFWREVERAPITGGGTEPN